MVGNVDAEPQKERHFPRFERAAQPACPRHDRPMRAEVAQTPKFGDRVERHERTVWRCEVSNCHFVQASDMAAAATD
jgi:hypothetical protein